MQAVVVLLVLQVLVDLSSSKIDTDSKSPYFQHLPDCVNTNYPVVRKQTDKKGIVCPMVKDEIGFLSEWTAFYEVQGFDHIIFFDNNSTTSFAELEPWVKAGFVTIVRDWWSHEKGLFENKANKFNDMMRVKMMAEVQCKQKAVEWGYEVFVSVDMDEYLMPMSNSVTVMDDLVSWFNRTTRGVALIPKLQFPPTPHILEPINLLTIEAYQTRMREPGKMNYYTSVCKTSYALHHSRLIEVNLMGLFDRVCSTKGGFTITGCARLQPKNNGISHLLLRLPRLRQL